MSFYLQVATETADLIERGDIQEGSATHHSDFERLLGLAEHKKKQKFLMEQKRNLALEELEEGRRKRAELREQMQHLRNQKIIEEAAQKKEEATKNRQEQTLRDRLNAALSKNAIELHQQNSKEHALLNTDPFLRFRAEENRIKTDKERFAAMKKVHGNSGSDLLRRFIEGASAWSTRKDLVLEQEEEKEENNNHHHHHHHEEISASKTPKQKYNKLKAEEHDESPVVDDISISLTPTSSSHHHQTTPSRGSVRSRQANVSNQSYTPTPSSSLLSSHHQCKEEEEKNTFQLDDNESEASPNKQNDQQRQKQKQKQKQQQQLPENGIPLTSMIRPELRVPTAANLVSNGYGREKSKTVCSGVYKANSQVESAFKQLDEQDKHDAEEWNHRREFYYRERSGVLEQMKAEGFFRRKFTDDAAPKMKEGAILGHDPEADRPSRDIHPIDVLHERVRDTVYDIHSASDSWKVLTANELTTKELTGAERAANITMMNNVRNHENGNTSNNNNNISSGVNNSRLFSNSLNNRRR